MCMILLLQALSIRPDILSPAAMNELQKLCDKVPSFDSAVAMQVGTVECHTLGLVWSMAGIVLPRQGVGCLQHHEL